MPADPLMLVPYAFLGFAPGLFWLWFFRRKDDFEPEPRLAVLRVFGLGCLSAGLILVARPLLEDLVPRGDGVGGEVVDAFLLTAVPEELAKLAAFLLGAFLSREFDEPLDGIVYGVAAGLGFASVENVLYIIQTGSPSVIVLRAFTATLGHVAFSGLLGWSFARGRFALGPKRIAFPVLGFAIAVSLHGTYNLFLSVGRGPQVLSLLVVLPFGLVLLGLKIRSSRARSREFHPELSSGGDRGDREETGRRGPRRD